MVYLHVEVWLGNQSNEICILFCLSILVQQTELLDHHCVCLFQTTSALLILNSICFPFEGITFVQLLCLPSTIKIWWMFLIIFFSCHSGLYKSFLNHDNNIPTPMLSILLVGHYFLMNLHFNSTVDSLCDSVTNDHVLSSKPKRIRESCATSADHMITFDNRSGGRGWMGVLRVPIWHCQPFRSFKSNVFFLSLKDLQCYVLIYDINENWNSNQNSPFTFTRWDYELLSRSPHYHLSSIWDSQWCLHCL